MIRQLNILTKQSPNTFQKVYNSFCINKIVYNPMMPLTQRYNAIYVSSLYEQQKIPKLMSRLVFWAPAAAMFANNYFTQWNGVNTAGFFGLLLAGSFVRFVNKQIIESYIYCLQVDPQLKWAYLTGKSFRVLKNSSIHKPFLQKQQQKLIDDYYPLKSKGIKVDLQKIHNPQNTSSLYQDKNYFKINRIQKLVDRCKIPLNKIKFTLDIPEKELPEFQRNKQRLSPKQMFKRYQNTVILVQCDLKFVQQNNVNNFSIKYRILAQNNVNKKYHDYLLALALGYQIDTKGNPQFSELQRDTKQVQTQQLLVKMQQNLKKDLKRAHQKQQKGNSKDKDK